MGPPHAVNVVAVLILVYAEREGCPQMEEYIYIYDIKFVCKHVYLYVYTMEICI